MFNGRGTVKALSIIAGLVFCAAFSLILGAVSFGFWWMVWSWIF